MAVVWEVEQGCGNIPGWSALLQAIGLAIAHSQYHRHGEYPLRNADMAGFSRQVRQVVALLVRAHRRRRGGTLRCRTHQNDARARFSGVSPVLDASPPDFYDSPMGDFAQTLLECPNQGIVMNR